jgi:hypothetical protein
MHRNTYTIILSAYARAKPAVNEVQLYYMTLARITRLGPWAAQHEHNVLPHESTVSTFGHSVPAHGHCSATAYHIVVVNSENRHPPGQTLRPRAKPIISALGQRVEK